MPTNKYFNFYNASNEQNLFEGLIIESIRNFGMDVHYILRENKDWDEVFRESTLSNFKDYFTIEAWLKSQFKFDGDGKFMSMELGYEIRDTMTLTISQKVFKQITGLDRAREGDLIYFPLDKKTYEIKFVDHQSVFYQLGKLYVYDLQLELLEYTGQTFETGLEDVDIINDIFPMDGTELGLEDFIDQSSELEADTDPIINFDPNDPFNRDS